MSVRKHHVIYSRRSQESLETMKCLRRNHWLMPPLEDPPHVELHRAISTVPLLDHHTAARVHREFEPVEGDYIASMWSLMRTIEQAIKHPRASHIEKGIGNLAVYAIEQQIPFVREGLAI
jgi:hypothetical protein